MSQVKIAQPTVRRDQKKIRKMQHAQRIVSAFNRKLDEISQASAGHASHSPRRNVSILPEGPTDEDLDGARKNKSKSLLKYLDQ